MYDVAAIAIGAACFLLAFAFLYLLERIWCRPPMHSASPSRSPSSRTSCTRCSEGSAS